MVISELKLWWWKRKMGKVRAGMTLAQVKERLGLPSRQISVSKTEIWAWDVGRDKQWVYSIRVALTRGLVCQVYMGMEPPGAAEKIAAMAGKADEEPFMEHPTDEFKTAIDAMEDAIRRLRELPKWDKWITFCAQGESSKHSGSYQSAEIRMLGDKLDVGPAPMDIAAIARAAGLKAGLVAASDGGYQLVGASPREAARILDAIFRHHLGIHPFADEDDDYAVGAEW
jgi:hypothetical protein